MVIKEILQKTWFHPRYLNKKYTRQSLLSLKHYARGRMLDIGCGLRPYESLFRAGITSYIGVDWPEAPGNAKPDIIADALALPLLNDSVDTVLACEVMEHLANPEQFIGEVARTLRINGSFIFSVPLMEPLHEEPRDYYRFTPYGLRFILEQLGFILNDIYPKGGLFVVLGSFITVSLYDILNPLDNNGVRRNPPFRLILALLLCFLIQGISFGLDLLFKGSKFTLGYTGIATLIDKFNNRSDIGAKQNGR